jgi:YidC/Oxa1 family membrane protein insertase
MAELQPKIQEIQKQHQNDKAKQSQAMMELYKKEKFNPFGGCLPLLVQLPILIAVYQVFLRGFNSEQLKFLYNFVPHQEAINTTFLGIINLSQSTAVTANGSTHYLIANIVLVVAAGVTQFLQSKMLIPQQQKISQKGDQMGQFSQMMQKQMTFLFPLFTVFILWKLPAAIALYWTVGNIFSIIQQKIIYSSKNNPSAGETKKQ